MHGYSHPSLAQEDVFRGQSSVITLSMINVFSTTPQGCASERSTLIIVWPNTHRAIYFTPPFAKSIVIRRLAVGCGPGQVFFFFLPVPARPLPHWPHRPRAVCFLVCCSKTGLPAPASTLPNTWVNNTLFSIRQWKKHAGLLSFSGSVFWF